MYFGVLRVRKEQEATDTTLRDRRPAATVTVYDTLKM
jgi:hypothetical protein